jgi:hypothetical protein
MSPGPSEARDPPLGDKASRQRFLARSIWFTVPGTIAVLLAAHRLVPPLAGLDDAGQRALFALKWLLVALLPYVAVCVHIAAARFVQGSHDPLAGNESETLKIHCRVMQNTLEQFVWFAFCIVPLATLLPAAKAGLIAVACTWFALARLVYWWGYLRRGTLGRAPGVQLTFTLNIAVLGHALALWVRQMLS